MAVRTGGARRPDARTPSSGSMLIHGLGDGRDASPLRTDADQAVDGTPNGLADRRERSPRRAGPGQAVNGTPNGLARGSGLGEGGGSPPLTTSRRCTRREEDRSVTTLQASDGLFWNSLVCR